MRPAPILTLAFVLGCRGTDKSDAGEIGYDPNAAVDADGDGHLSDTDCDDDDPAVHPEAQEACNDIDDDCDGEVDEGLDQTVFLDADGDGWGDDEATLEACETPEGYVAEGGDCDDLDASTHPDATEICDEVDNDCDGAIDEDVTTAFYADADDDGHGDELSTTEACELPADHTIAAGDCDDGDAAVNPDATEVCNGIDDDCDGVIDPDDAEDASTWYTDADSDSYGTEPTTTACEKPFGFADNADDCDDTSRAISPADDETCNGIDDDCDGLVDDDDNSVTGTVTWFRDADEDGYGSADHTQDACDEPSGYVDDDTDCDDLDVDVNPVADEVCDGVDNDCDGLTDDDDNTLDTSTQDTFYADTDRDGFGDPNTSTEACDEPSGYVEDDEDCDDTDEDVNPDADDECDGIDNDCDGTTDPTGVDSDGDGTDNCVDSSVWSDDFDDSSWGSWSTVDLGGGNTPVWAMSGNMLHETSNAALSIALGPDLGELYEYTVSVDVSWRGTANNGAAIAFDYVDTSTYWLARWLDPNDYYGSYPNGGHLDLYRCESGTCTMLADDDGSTDLTVSTYGWNTLSVSVADDDITVALDGVDYVTYTASGEAPLGAGTVGVWTYDNDGGVYYDDFAVTNP